MAANWDQLRSPFGWPMDLPFLVSLISETHFKHTLEGLSEIYAALPDDWKMFVEYKAFEPNFYSTTVGDWGQSLVVRQQAWAESIYTG